MFIECMDFLWTLNWTNQFTNDEHERHFLNHHRKGHDVKYQERVKMCVCLCSERVGVYTHTHTGPRGPAHTHSRRQRESRAAELVKVKPVSYFVEEQWQQTVKIQRFHDGPPLLNDQSRSSSWFVQCWSFLWPPPKSCWPALTLTSY